MTLKGLIEKVKRLEEELDYLDTRIKRLERDVVIPVFTGEYEYNTIIGEHRETEDVRLKDVAKNILTHLGLVIEATPASTMLKPSGE